MLFVMAFLYVIFLAFESTSIFLVSLLLTSKLKVQVFIFKWLYTTTKCLGI